MRMLCRTGAYAVCLGLLSATAAADDAERIIEHRIAGFRDMGAAFKSIGDELKTPRPNVSRIRDSALVVKDYSKQVPGWFPSGSEPPEKPSQSWLEWVRSLFSSDSGFVATSVYDSKAKPEIWQQQAKFTQSYKEFQNAVDALWSTVQGSDVTAIKERHRAAGKTCANCHDGFRERMD
ncbi:MAG TPA: cytochrome c [Steroidobacter sp.]